LVVGKRRVKAYTLAKGEKAWEIEAGEPSGFGVASDNVYYLPLRESAESKEPEVCAIDVAKGKIVAHAKSREENGKRQAPGSLVFADGQMLSMTTRELVAYPLLKTRLAEIDALLKKNPNDPAALTEQGELHLNDGDLQRATEELGKALENKPAQDVERRARELLYETLTEYFRRDFDKAEKYLKDYEGLALGVIDREGATASEKEQFRAEEKRRRAVFLILVAQGRERQGKYREALQMYFKLGESRGDGDLMPNPQEPALKVDRMVWVRQRIADMLKNAPADKAKELQEEVDKKWKDLQGAKDQDKK
jgi:tetratricopeptide (TPR) repeat protein